MGKNPTYLCECLKKKLINPEVLKKVCKYYDLTPEDYILTEEVEKKQIQQKADTMNYDNVILLLTDISKTLKELLAAEKSTQFMLGELKNSMMKSNSHEKQILEKMEAAEKQKQAHRNTVSKIYGA